MSGYIEVAGAGIGVIGAFFLLRGLFGVSRELIEQSLDGWLGSALGGIACVMLLSAERGGFAAWSALHWCTAGCAFVLVGYVFVVRRFVPGSLREETSEKN